MPKGNRTNHPKDDDFSPPMQRWRKWCRQNKQPKWDSLFLHANMCMDEAETIIRKLEAKIVPNDSQRELVGAIGRKLREDPNFKWPGDSKSQVLDDIIQPYLALFEGALALLEDGKNYLAVDAVKMIDRIDLLKAITQHHFFEEKKTEIEQVLKPFLARAEAVRCCLDEGEWDAAKVTLDILLEDVSRYRPNS